MSTDALLKKYKDFITSADVERPKSKFRLGPLGINIAAGNPRGIPSGRIVQITGKQSSGKSTLALDIVRLFQEDNPGAKVLYVDFERSFDGHYAQSCGVNLDDMYIVRAPSTEVGFTVAKEAVRDHGIKLVVIDSVAMAVPEGELVKTFNDNAKMASGASLITRFVNHMVPTLDDADACMIIINQLRKNFNTMSPETETTYGGNALQYAIAVTIWLQHTKKAETEQFIRATIRKNKIGAPHKLSEFVIVYGKGIDHARDIVDLGIAYGIVEKNGSWYTYKTHKVQGTVAAAEQFPIEDIRRELFAIVEREDSHGSTESIEY
jgi:recombination protein RecA